MSGWIASLQKWWAAAGQRQKLTAALLGFSLLSTVALLSMNGASGTSGDPLGSTPLYFVSVFIKLIGVLLLIVLCALLFRRWMTPGARLKTTRQLQLLETVRLSPKQALHLVSIGGQRLLIGATDQAVSLISPVEAVPVPEATEVPAPQPAPDFSSLLQSFHSQPPAASSK